jgi:hypothetical protein
VKWLADECFDNDIVRGLLRRFREFDVIRAQGISEIAGCDDGKLLAWAIANERIVLTHDFHHGSSPSATAGAVPSGGHSSCS